VTVGPGSPAELTIEDAGRELTFATSDGDVGALRGMIARALAMVLRVATRAHWSLILRALEQPFARWERGQPAAGSDESEADRVWGKLEKHYLRLLEQELTQILQRWGIGEPLTHTDVSQKRGYSME
jgi:hypothetical protein